MFAKRSLAVKINPISWLMLKFLCFVLASFAMKSPNKLPTKVVLWLIN